MPFNFRLWLALGFLLWNAAPLPAQCVSRQFVRRAVVKQNNFVVTQFAVPVGVPVVATVAEASPFFYSYSPHSYKQEPQVDEIDILADKIAQRLGISRAEPRSAPPVPQAEGSYNQNVPPPQPQPTPPDWSDRSDQGVERVFESVVATKCASCHGHGEKSKPMAVEAIDLSDISALTDAERLKAIRVSWSRAMPPHPSTPLTVQELEIVTNELTREP